MRLEFLEEGHYKEGENQYMSIWTYKRLFNLNSNETTTNYEEAKRIVCEDRKWLPFNESNRFKAGWHYNLGCLKAFYERN
jgi:hypothetical protein